MGLAQLADSLEFVADALKRGGASAGDGLPRPMLDNALHVYGALADAQRRVRSSAVGHCNVPRLHNQLVQLLTVVQKMKPGDVYIVPAGWCRPPGEYVYVFLFCVVSLKITTLFPSFSFFLYCSDGGKTTEQTRMQRHSPCKVMRQQLHHAVLFLSHQLEHSTLY